MSLREYILRRQATLRDTVQTIRIETLPVVNALAEDTVDVGDFFAGSASRTDRDEEELKAFRYEVSKQTDLVDDWSLVDPIDKQPEQPDAQ
jgi:hypothetical protein